MPILDIHNGAEPILGRNRFWVQPLLVGVCVFLGSTILAWADDFLRDPTRLEDGLRTGGWAAVIAGTASTVVSVLVNGSVILQTTLNRPGDDDDEDGEPTKWSFDVRTEDSRTELVPDGEDMMWIYARVLCNKPEKRPEMVTRGVTFGVQGTHADWVTLGRPAMQGGAKAIRIKAEPPNDDAELTDEKITILVTATIEGSPMTAPVELSLEAKDYIVDTEFKGVWA